MDVSHLIVATHQIIWYGFHSHHKMAKDQEDEAAKSLHKAAASPFQVLLFAFNPVPLVGIWRGILARIDIWPDFRQFGIE